MNQGYCINGGDKYYCSDACLLANMSRKTFNKLYDNGNGDSYYTEWEYDPESADTD